MLLERLAQRRVTQHGDDLVRHVVDVPEVHLQRVAQDLAHSGRPADQHRHVMSHRLERRDAEGL